MQIRTFDGGLSTRVDPSLIEDNEAVVYSNIDNTSKVLVSALDSLDLEQTVTGFFYKFGDDWLSSTSERSYVEYQNKLFWSEIDGKASKFDGFRQVQLGIDTPTEALTATEVSPGGSGISGDAETLQYTYTYYNSEDDIESAPAPLSEELSLAANKDVELEDFIVSPDVQVDKIRIYRIGDGITTMTLVMEVDNVVATLTDDIPTLDLPGTILDTYSNQAPLLGIKHMIEAYGHMFAVYENKLYYSMLGKPDYWPAVNYIEFSRELTGIAEIPNGLLVFSRTKTWMLVGTTPSSFTKLLVSEEYGTIAHSSIKTVKNVPVWVSLEGITAYQNGLVAVISKPKLGTLRLSVVNTAVFDEQYFVCLTDGTLLVMDFRFGMIFKTFTLTEDIDNILAYDGSLYGRQDSALVELFAGDPLSFTYLSPNYSEGAHSMQKAYNNIYIRSRGEFVITVFIDNVEVLVKNLDGDVIHDVKPPQEVQRGSSIQFKITGVGTVYEIDYKVLGRQNGR